MADPAFSTYEEVEKYYLVITCRCSSLCPLRLSPYGAHYIKNILYQEMTPKKNHPPVKVKQENLNHIRLQQPSLAQYDAFIIKRKKIMTDLERLKDKLINLRLKTMTHSTLKPSLNTPTKKIETPYLSSTSLLIWRQSIADKMPLSSDSSNPSSTKNSPSTSLTSTIINQERIRKSKSSISLTWTLSKSRKT
jgi:hypothetical protein